VVLGFRREMRTAWRRASGLRVHETPLFMRLRRTLPMVTMRLLGRQSQGQRVDFHSFLAGFLGFCLFLAHFVRF
jgi:hypothetical protein